MSGDTPDWKAISEALRRPIDPEDVDLRIQGDVNESDGTARVVAYIDARTVDDLLDEVVGVGNWSFDWTPLLVDKGEVQIAKGVITIFGVSKADVGIASNTEPTKGCISDALKRAAARWGIGRYLYGIRLPRGKVQKYGRSWSLTNDSLRELRAKLPRPSGAQPASAPPQSPTQRQGAPTPIRAALTAPAPAQRASEDLSGQRVPADQQRDLLRKIHDTFGYERYDEYDTWLNDKIKSRTADSPRGVIGAEKLYNGKADIDMAEQSLILGMLDSQRKVSGAQGRH